MHARHLTGSHGSVSRTKASLCLRGPRTLLMGPNRFTSPSLWAVSKDQVGAAAKASSGQPSADLKALLTPSLSPIHLQPFPVPGPFNPQRVCSTQDFSTYFSNTEKCQLVEEMALGSQGPGSHPASATGVSCMIFLCLSFLNTTKGG